MTFALPKLILYGAAGIFCLSLNNDLCSIIIVGILEKYSL